MTPPATAPFRERTSGRGRGLVGSLPRRSRPQVAGRDAGDPRGRSVPLWSEGRLLGGFERQPQGGSDEQEIRRRTFVGRTFRRRTIGWRTIGWRCLPARRRLLLAWRRARWVLPAGRLLLRGRRLPSRRRFQLAERTPRAFLRKVEGDEPLVRSPVFARASEPVPPPGTPAPLPRRSPFLPAHRGSGRGPGLCLRRGDRRPRGSVRALRPLHPLSPRPHLSPHSPLRPQGRLPL